MVTSITALSLQQFIGLPAWPHPPQLSCYNNWLLDCLHGHIRHSSLVTIIRYYRIACMATSTTALLLPALMTFVIIVLHVACTLHPECSGWIIGVGVIQIIHPLQRGQLPRGGPSCSQACMIFHFPIVQVHFVFLLTELRCTFSTFSIFFNITTLCLLLLYFAPKAYWLDNRCRLVR